ncbi:MAG: hypothetical protein IJ915_00210 [Paludibacteraceae bacterium]|nr:hypothetical protein [Paludibacteraceae bacterium]
MLLPACSAVRSSTESNYTQLSTHIQRDSIYLHDSVLYTYRPAKISLPYREGAGVGSPPDTVYLEKWHTRWRDRATVKTDTITLTETKTETVEKPYVPSFYKYCAAFAILVVLYLLVRLALYIKRHF